MIERSRHDRAVGGAWVDDRDVTEIDVDEYWLRDLLGPDLAALERLLAAHAGFDSYLRERGRD